MVNETRQKLSALVRFLIRNLRLSDQNGTRYNAIQTLNYAFLLELAGHETRNHNDSRNRQEIGDLFAFYRQARQEIESEFNAKYQSDEQFALHVDKALLKIEQQECEDLIQEAVWQVFFPEAAGLTLDSDAAVQNIRERRRIAVTSLNPEPLTDPGRQLIFTSNILLTKPLPEDDGAGTYLDPGLKSELGKISNEPQLYWYDHPIPLGIPPAQNEILYGLKGLDAALEWEKKHGNVTADTRSTCLLSVSVTHDGLHKISKDYIESEFKRSGGIKNLDVYVFTETDTEKILTDVLIPAAEKYLDAGYGNSALRCFGVDGEYGRHYSFLKAITAFWHVLIDPAKTATFKIDLDQIFPQEELVRETGFSALEHFKTPLWGAKGTDSAGRPSELGMIAGALVNEADITQSLFTPDVKMPAEKPAPDEQVFFSRLPQAVSTRAEMMLRYDQKDFNGKTSCLQRVHVTGGTNGILIDTLRRHRPFTPSFIGRAEDQAYLISVFNNYTSLGYAHKDGLIMRHDKANFAREAIAAAKVGKLIGDYTRILIFSAYGNIVDPGLTGLKSHLDPFTGCFISRIPLTTVYLRFALKTADFWQTNQSKLAADFMINAAKRIPSTIDFTRGPESKMEQTYSDEKNGWNIYYDCLDLLEQHIDSGDDFALNLREKAQTIIAECALRDVNIFM